MIIYVQFLDYSTQDVALGFFRVIVEGEAKVLHAIY